jgi:hypothetical protein
MALTKVKNVIDITADTMADLLSMEHKTGSVQLLGYHERGDGGGGVFYWDSSKDKADHNGGTVIDPDVTYPTDWTNQTQLAAWFTAGSGAGCWVRQYDGDVNVKWFGAKCNAELSSLGVLSGTDDSLSVQAGIDFANKYGIKTVNAFGKIRLDSTINILAGVILFGGEYASNPRYRIGTGWEKLTGSILFINHSSGVSVDDYTKAGFSLDESSAIHGYSVIYPSQDMTATIPTVFPPTIAINPTVQNPSIGEINFVNSYSAIDARRDHATVKIKNVFGYPLAYGLRIGSMSDNDYIDTVHFQPLYGYRGEATSLNSLAGWINENGIALDLGRISHTKFNDVFAYGYLKGVNGYYQASGTNINNPGGLQGDVVFENCGFDSCYYPYYITHGSHVGNVHYGVTIDGGAIIPRDAFNSGKDNSIGIFWDSDSTGEADDLVITGGVRIHSGREHGVIINNARGVHVDSSVRFIEWGIASGGYAVVLNGCEDVNIDGYFDGQATSSRRAVHLQNNNSKIKINGMFEDFVSAPITIDASSNSNYHINGLFAMTTTIDPVVDFQKNGNSTVNIKYVKPKTFSGDSDVDGSGILQLFNGQSFTKYVGTTAINGLSQGYVGQTVTVRFSNVITVTDGAGGVGTSVLRLSGNFVTSADDIITLVSDGTAWYEVSRSSN